MKIFTKISVVVVLVVTGAAGPVSAQSGLEEVEALTRLGRADEAREALTEWWEGDRAEASRRELQRGLWLRARLTVDPVQAELDFQRLTVLYPSGQFTSQAVLRLAQSSFAMGDEDEARQYVATLVRDYPSSEARSDGEAWLAAAGPVPPPGDTPRQAVEEEEEVEREPEPQPEEADIVAVSNYYVQLGAFADEARAFALYDDVLDAGVDVRVVRVAGSRFTHVRVGRFADREGAVDRLDELTAAGINAALVRDDREEEVVRN
jgi:cell division septation protein DedD